MRGVVIVLGAVFLLAACGGGSSSQASADTYRSQLAKIKQESDQAQAQVEKGLSAKTIAELRSKLDAFASASQRISDEVAKLDAPENAAAANAELAQGEHDTATATRAASTAIAKLKTAQAALAYLQSKLGNARGAHELDDAIAKLKKLGYTSGS